MNKTDILELHKDERTQCQTWTRVMGYYRNTSNFNLGKVGEFEERTPFTEKAALSRMKNEIK